MCGLLSAPPEARKRKERNLVAKCVAILDKADSAAQRAATEAIFPGAMQPGPLVAFGGQSFPDAGEVVVLTYISPPLLPILKELNAYSNNVFHDFAEAAGGGRSAAVGPPRLSDRV